MSHYFTKDGIRGTSFSVSQELVEALRMEWMEHMETISPYPDKFEGRGIVMCAGGLNYFVCAWVAIKTLRNTGCVLPIELWYCGDELSPETITTLNSLGVRCKDILNYEPDASKGYMMKPLVIFYSSFKEVLFLDADNVCVKDPTSLFDEPEYLEYGTIFWPDYWRTSDNNQIWEITGVKTDNMQEQESGQMLINKQKCWNALNLCVFFNNNHYIYYSFLLGDKDTFKLAWLTQRTPFHWIRKEVGTVGYVYEDKFYGITMVQHDLHGEILFLHRNLFKWPFTSADVRVWHKIKRFTSNGVKKEYIIDHAVFDHDYMDLEGDIEILDFEQLFGSFENDCMQILNDLRDSDVYKRFEFYTKEREN